MRYFQNVQTFSQHVQVNVGRKIVTQPNSRSIFVLKEAFSHVDWTGYSLNQISGSFGMRRFQHVYHVFTECTIGQCRKKNSDSTKFTFHICPKGGIFFMSTMDGMHFKRTLSKFRYIMLSARPHVFIE